MRFNTYAESVKINENALQKTFKYSMNLSGYSSEMYKFLKHGFFNGF
jgi:hypothetical protein